MQLRRVSRSFAAAASIVAADECTLDRYAFDKRLTPREEDMMWLIRAGSALFHHILFFAISACLLSLSTLRAPAQDFSGKPIRIIVGLAAGGATDVMARLIAQKLGIALNTSAFVDNRPGGLFIPAFRELAAAPPDGHTLLMISTSALVTQPLHPGYPFDIRAMTAVTEVASGPLILVVRKGMPIKNMADLVAHDRQNPGTLKFGSGGGTGSSMYLATELLKMRTGITPVHVPYKGNAAALSDLLGGHIDLMFDAMPVMAEQVKVEAVRPLIVTSAQRSATLPDVPTAREAGLRDFLVEGWFGLLAPPNTPEAVVRRLRDEVAKAVNSPDVLAQFAVQGVLPVANEPEQWRDTISAELDRWSKLINAAGIKAE
jgi:tripartite-type tricarboxylate transporter receptor subunit TctC